MFRGACAPRIALITDERGWHSARLEDAFATYGFESTCVSLSDCYLELSAEKCGVFLPGFEDHLPAAVFVRGIAAGTLEQIVLRLDVLHALKALDVLVYNDARAIERTVDKAMTSFLLRCAQIPTPPTWVCESTERARHLIQQETARGRRLVMKPLFGSQGSGLRLIDRLDALPELEEYGGVYYLQSFIERGAEDWYDWRVLVVEGHARTAMRRHNHHWVTNCAKGARCEPVTVSGELGTLAEAASRVVGADYAGVDLMCDQAGRLLVVEINSIPAWRGLQSVSCLDVAGCLAAHLVSRLRPPEILVAVP
jgi:alpha-L-glutamate ligases, RimK family